MRHELTSGAWVEMRPVQDLKVRDRDVFEAPVRDIDLGMTEDGKPDRSAVKFNLRTPEIQRRALLCRLLKAWSFANDDGGPLPLPRWEGGISSEESFFEVPLGDWDEITELLKPYVAKIENRPDPKGSRSGTTTASNGSSTTTGPGRSRQA